LEELELTKDLMRSVTEQSIAEKTDRINELEKQMMIIGDTNIELSKRIEDQQRIIQSQISQTEEKLNERDNMDEQLRKSEIYPHLLFLINTKRKLNKKDWDKLKETFQRISPIFMEHLLGSCVMNEVELEISLLCRIGISPSDIAGLLNFSRSHISFIRRGLYKKVFGKEGKPSKWDEYVYLL